MSTKEPEYVRRRNQREQKAEDRARSDRDTQERENNIAAINALTEEVRGYKSEQQKTEPKKITTDRVAAVAAVIAALLSLGSLVAFVCLTLKTDSTAQSGVGVSSRQLHEMQVEQRPWIYADIATGGAIYKNQSGGLNIPINFTFRNTGHLPAMYVSPDIEGYLSGFNGESASTTVRDRQKNRCSRQLQQPKATDQIGTTVFPGQNVVFGAGVGITAAEIANVQKILRERSPNFAYLSPWVTGCIRYRSPDGAFHQSGVAFTVVMTEPGKIGLRALPMDPTTVDPQYLVMSPWIEGGTWYAN